jgi:hypothetical protein
MIRSRRSAFGWYLFVPYERGDEPYYTDEVVIDQIVFPTSVGDEPIGDVVMVGGVRCSPRVRG